MTLDDLKNKYKTSYNFEMKTGINHVNWVHWFNSYGYIPLGSQLKIERITKGDLKADINHIPQGDYKCR